MRLPPQVAGDAPLSDGESVHSSFSCRGHDEAVGGSGARAPDRTSPASAVPRPPRIVAPQGTVTECAIFNARKCAKSDAH